MNKDTSNDHRRPFVRKNLLVGSVAAMLCVLGVSLFFSRHFFLAEIANNFRLQIFFVMLLCSALFLWMGYRVLSLVLGIVAVIVFGPVAIGMLPADQPEAGPRKISLVSFNVLGENTNQTPIIEFLDSNTFDVLVVVEYANDWIEPLSKLGQRYPYVITKPRWHGFGLAVYSRFPIVDSKVHQLTKNATDNPFVTATIDVDGQNFNLSACHFLAPLTPTNMGIRNRQIEQAAAIIRNLQNQNGFPTILTGDFNCVAWSPFAVDLMKTASLRDSRKGYSYHGSWPVDNSLLSIPIDNAFVSNAIHVHERKILPGLSSDHFPLFVEFSIEEREIQFKPNKNR